MMSGIKSWIGSVSEQNVVLQRCSERNKNEIVRVGIIVSVKSAELREWTGHE
jgi:hypothetical protein